MGTRATSFFQNFFGGVKSSRWIILSIFACILLTNNFVIASAKLEGLDEDYDDYDEQEIVTPKPRSVSKPAASAGQKHSKPKANQPPKFKAFSDDGSEDDAAEETTFGKPKPRSAKGRDNKAGGRESLLRQVDEWDEEEFEGIPNNFVEDKFLPRRKEVAKKKAAKIQTDFTYEKIAMGVIAVYILNYFVGRILNAQIAQKWADTFTGDDGIFGRNFSLLGPGNPDMEWGNTHLMKESQNEFRFYCSGRMCAERVMATILLRPRQDLFNYILRLFKPMDDLIKVEVAMGSDHMEQSIFCMCPIKSAKNIISENKEVKDFTTLQVPLADRKKPWVHPRVGVMAESYEVANDLVHEWMVDHVFGLEAWPVVGKYFQMLLFSDQTEEKEDTPNTFPGHKKVLKFFFKLPENKRMEELAPMMELVCRTIDVVGRHKLSASAAKKADDIRKKLEEKKFKETLNDRQEALARKKMEKLEAEKEKEANMSKKALEKKERKDYKAQMKKQNPRMKLQRVK